jgi:TDG/mug DNA glycosylase family protein
MNAPTGFQVEEDWMGHPVTTLADVWPSTPVAAIVGLNPAPVSVAAGHYYQGSSGQRQLGRLVEAGVLPPTPSRYFEEGALEAGIGLTDIVKRPTSGENGVTSAEIAHGTPALAAKLEQRGTRLIICVFRHPVLALLGVEADPGLCPLTTSWGARVFRMPGPFEKRTVAMEILRELPGLLARS